VINKKACVFFSSAVLTSTAFFSCAAFDYNKAVDEIAADPLTSYNTVYLGMPKSDFDLDFSMLPDWSFYKNEMGVNEKAERETKIDGTTLLEGIKITTAIPAGSAKVIAFDCYFKTDSKKIAKEIYDRAVSTVWSGVEDMPVAQASDFVFWKQKDISIVVSYRYEKDENQYVITIRRFNNRILNQ